VYNGNGAVSRVFDMERLEADQLRTVCLEVPIAQVLHQIRVVVRKGLFAPEKFPKGRVMKGRDAVQTPVSQLLIEDIRKLQKSRKRLLVGRSERRLFEISLEVRNDDRGRRQRRKYNGLGHIAPQAVDQRWALASSPSEAKAQDRDRDPNSVHRSPQRPASRSNLSHRLPLARLDGFVDQTRRS